MVAVALGFLGAIFGVIAVIVAVGGSRAGFGLGVATLIFAILGSGAGVAGTLLGKKQVEAAMPMVENDVDRELILRVGHKEASGAAVLGAFGALLPLLLGAIAALAGARAAANTPQRRQGIDLSPTEVQGSETSGRAVLAVVFIGIAALAASGAWVTGHRPPPHSKYDFPEDDHDAWELARGVNDVERATRPDARSARKVLDDDALERACTRLEQSLNAYWKTDDRRQWPRVFTGVPPSITGWKEAAGRCIEAQLAGHAADGEALRAELTTDALLDSPLLLDEQLKQRVLARERQRVDAPPPDAPPADGDEATGTLDKSEIQRVLRANLKKLTFCYERALIKNPTLEGKLVVDFVISTTGAVSRADEVDGPFPDKQVSDCVTKEVRALTFPRPLGGGVVNVRYPFVFKAAQ